MTFTEASTFVSFLLQEQFSSLYFLRVVLFLEAGERWARLAQARAASRPGLCAIAPGRRAGAPPLWQLARSFPVTGPQPLSSLRRAGNRASRPGHRALARSSLLRDWFPCAGAVLSLAQTHRGRPQTTSTRLYAGGELQGSPVWQALPLFHLQSPLTRPQNQMVLLLTLPFFSLSTPLKFKVHINSCARLLCSVENM